ncbi:hypothetical protein FIBSPDRAFT_951762 [Athelia psychrophila]|uniref:Uncharacterized protein n=1 Tax=Athelia psychrophila TaxID=1759441 RepID=A0A166MD23_9AGAM|nr:hypothetical protein FIBSPDRAFT_951762 [Fibularhizoctonia sp. CBS 109695]
MFSKTFDEAFRTGIETKVILGADLVTTNKAGTRNYTQALRRTGVSPDPKTIILNSSFRLASTGKLPTTIAALQCVKRCLFPLDSPDDIARLFPKLAAP